jgi:hypothetical protein
MVYKLGWTFLPQNYFEVRKSIWPYWANLAAEYSTSKDNGNEDDLTRRVRRIVHEQGDFVMTNAREMEVHGGLLDRQETGSHVIHPFYIVGYGVRRCY